MIDSNEFVLHPRHYSFRLNGKDVQSWDVLDALFRNNALLWNACKYLIRIGNGGKNNDLEDLRKARQYLSREIARIESSDASVSNISSLTTISISGDD